MGLSRKERQRLIDDVAAQIDADRPPRDDGRATPRGGKQPRRVKGKGGRK
jgi:hypothetical protein